MSSSSIAVYRVPSHVDLVRTCNEAASGLGWDLLTDVESKLCSILLKPGEVTTVWLRAIGLAPSRFYEALGLCLQSPWMEIQKFENVIWGYSLYVDDTLRDQFATHAEIWGLSPDECQAYRGDVAVLSESWGVDTDKVSRYLKHWEQNAAWMSGRAYPEDHAGYGSVEQRWDFTRAIGGHAFLGNEEPGLSIRVPIRL